jgi:hypothetical protein
MWDKDVCIYTHTFYSRALAVITFMTELTGIFKDIEEHTYTADKCFLCGCKLSPDNQTLEHVVPKWIQKRFNLWDQKIHLLNGTTLPYRNLTIPCCFQCNNRFLEPFERKILKAFNGGFQAFQQLDSETIFLWIGKIYFGMMYRELFLSADRANAAAGTITSPEFLQSYYSHFLFIQGIRGRHRFKDFFPASIFLFKTQTPSRIEEQWDYKDNNNILFISIRMADIGIIAALQDGQSTQQFENDLAKYTDIGLHPRQFDELTAQLFYKSSLFNRTPKYINVQSANDEVVETIQMSLQGLSSKPIFNEWMYSDYAKILSHMTGVSLDKIQPEDEKIVTWLHDGSGQPKFIPLEK